MILLSNVFIIVYNLALMQLHNMITDYWGQHNIFIIIINSF